MSGKRKIKPEGWKRAPKNIGRPKAERIEWRERVCLRCNRMFLSSNPFNRLCGCAMPYI